MSAQIVDKSEIIYLVQAATAWRLDRDVAHLSWYHGVDDKGLHVYNSLEPGTYDKAAAVAQMLWNINRASVAHRYGTESELPGSIGEAFIIEEIDIQNTKFREFDPVQVLKSCQHYAYQSCELPTWKETEAFAFIEALKDKAICALLGWKEAKWGAPNPVVMS